MRTVTKPRPTINETIIETLYEDALTLAEEARAIFDPRAQDRYHDASDAVRVALSIEGLRTTTRLMQTLAWLLNQRAYLSGELSLAELREHGTLAEDRASEELQLAKLYPETQALIRETERLHARVARLDADWRDEDDRSPVEQLRGRLAQAFEPR